MPGVRQRFRFVVPAAILLGALPSASCGPSVQSIYEGDVRFEHCYRLDLELDVAPTHRQACWTAWLDRYTYGQSRDKLEYARRRVRAFASGDADKPTLRLAETQAQQDARQFYLVVPAPTSVHASPPPIATLTNLPMAPAPSNSAEAPAKSSAKSSDKSSDRATPAEDCTAACKGAFSSCNQACDPATKSAACKSCDPDYKKCMARCFE
jgi:hypothetical protein